MVVPGGERRWRSTQQGVKEAKVNMMPRSSAGRRSMAGARDEEVGIEVVELEDDCEAIG